MAKSGERISVQIEGGKTDFLSRPMPEEYKAIPSDVFYNFPQVFSRYLESVSYKELFEMDEFGNMQYDVLAENSYGALEGEHLTEFGKSLSGSIKGKEFVDLGCGHPNASILPRQLAKTWEAERYIGVDTQLVADSVVLEQDNKGNKFESLYIKSDILSFLARIPDFQKGAFFYLAGIEPLRLFDEESLEHIKRYNPEAYELDQNARKYINACMSELERLSKGGDAILIGPATYGFDPKLVDFQVRAKDRHHSLYIRQQ